MSGQNIKKSSIATIFAILAAALYAINIPLSKILIAHAQPMMMAGFLYFGAGVGMSILMGFRKLNNYKTDNLTKAELPYVIMMVLLDIAAPILLMFGISKTNSANVSLLNNFEIVVTSIIALLIFKEMISRRLWIAIIFICIASAILSFEGEGSFVFNEGSLLVLGACCCWGLENNCTKMISNKNSEEIVMIKGCFSGIGSLIIAFISKESFPAIGFILAVMLLGFVSYGLSINFYIKAQKDLGAAKTSAYYSIAPFLGVFFSMLLLGEKPALNFYIALFIMIVSTVIMVKDTIELQHSHAHQHTHTHEHRHGDLVHTHEHTHEHSHWHVHGGSEEHGHIHKENELVGHEHVHSA